MTNILIRNVLPEAHQTLVRRAKARGLSLQQFLSSELNRLAATPTVDEVLSRVEANRGGRVGLGQAVEDLASERSRR
ncbi:hypothetical protein [Arthrobacter sp. H5]|uniref:hypothetical protein n=1 Tax=Arthrobacter sp. H5 TaxID=1267973 RepID=UPI00055EBBBB|nr:hypothetical protein [Arthrobacter sp. H5]